MGEVYRALDPQLGREVAIKVLPEALAGDRDRLARLGREARALAALNHPNELVEGETLAERIARGPVPVDEAVTVFVEIARGLEAAHEGGIIHRDLKPANIKLQAPGPADPGGVKILDFGLARATAEPEPGSGTAISESPTLTLAATQRGEILGTAAYMSPEQASGKVVDKRTDIWAFGCCLYEALTGQKLFAAEDAANTLAAVLRDELDFTGLPGDIPAPIHELLARCLVRKQLDRLRDIGDARWHLEHLASPTAISPEGPSASDGKRPGTRAVIAGIAGLVIGAAIAGVFLLRDAPPTEEASPRRYSINLPDHLPVGGSHIRSRPVALSRDGRWLAYRTNAQGADASPASGALVLRSMSDRQARLLPGTEGANDPYFSPDGEWIGFSRGGRVFKVAVSGGPPVDLGPGLMSWAWSEDGYLLANENLATGLGRVPAAGGAYEPATQLGQQEAIHLQAHPIPGTQVVLITTATQPAISESTLIAMDLESGERAVIAVAAASGQWSPTGHVLYSQTGRWQAVRFDPETLRVLGSPFPVTEPEMVVSDTSLPQEIAISDDGTLVFVPGGIAGSTVFLRAVDAAGNGKAAGVQGSYDSFSLSPDGRRAALVGPGRVVVFDRQLETIERITDQSNVMSVPLWSADSQRLAYASDGAIVLRRVDGLGEEERLLAGAYLALDWTPDGDLLVCADTMQETGRRGLDQTSSGVFVVEGGQAREVWTEDGVVLDAAFSKDGKWLAYQAFAGQQMRIYVRPWPEVDTARWQVSAGSMRGLRWTESGSLLLVEGAELFEWHPGNDPGNAARPEKRLEMPAFAGVIQQSGSWDLDPTNGEVLYLAREARPDTGPRNRLMVVENWFAELRRHDPGS